MHQNYFPSGFQKVGLIINKTSDKLVQICFSDDEHIIPQFEIYINHLLAYNIRVYNWILPQEHDLIKLYNGSMTNITLSNLISTISVNSICQGITCYKSDSLLRHFVPKKFMESSVIPLLQTEFIRPPNCLVLCHSLKCSTCSYKEQYHEKLQQKKSEKLLIPAKTNAPISLTSPERIKLTLQNHRIKNKELQTRIENLQQELKTSSVSVSNNLNNDLRSIMSNADSSKVSPFMTFFWEQQQKYLQSSSSGVRYHPMIIRYCLSLAAKSSSAYDDMRYDEKTGTGFLVLPSRRRLRDYKNYIRPQRGFNKDIVTELQHKVENFTDPEKFIVLLFDEMKIQENLVWDKHSGELIGSVDLGDPSLNYAAS